VVCNTLNQPAIQKEEWKMRQGNEMDWQTMPYRAREPAKVGLKSKN
jgi:hypothetical protein